MTKTFFVFLGLVAVAAVGTLYALGYIKMPTGGVDNPAVLAIKQKGTLVVGTDASYPPLEDKNEQGDIVGFDVDLADLIAKEFGVKLEIKDIAFDTIFDSLKKGEVDMVISAVTITPERSEQMAFSNPYFNAGQSLVVVDSSAISSTDDLAGKRMGVQKDTTSQVEAEKYTDKKSIRLYDTYDPASVDLMKGTIDAVIIDYPAAVNMVSQNAGLAIAGEPFTSEFYGIAVAKEQSGLLTIVNRVIAKMKDSGQLDQLKSTWFAK